MIIIYINLVPSKYEVIVWDFACIAPPINFPEPFLSLRLQDSSQTREEYCLDRGTKTICSLDERTKKEAFEGVLGEVDTG
jgi:hypothetical protein